MNLGRSASRERLDRAWADGFSPAGRRLLAPITLGYRGLVGAREWLYASGVFRSRRADCLVVSVGNITVGGTGKTPAVILATETLIALGERPAVVSRGYGRRTTGVQVVADTASIRVDAEDGGDEPFVLARRLPGVPVVVGANRSDAARVAVERFGATAIVLDDAFQHRTLEKDLEIVMARARAPWGNGCLLPAGPLREPIEALRRADIVVATGVSTADDIRDIAETLRRRAPGVPVVGARYVATECWDAARMKAIPLDRLRGTRVLAFAGIAHPAGFGRTLVDLDADLAELVAFDDHHWYDARELDALAERASRAGAQALVTTEKDWVRLRRLRAPACAVWVVGVRLVLVGDASAWHAAFAAVTATR